jgi:hypothetical protein
VPPMLDKWQVSPRHAAFVLLIPGFASGVGRVARPGAFRDTLGHGRPKFIEVHAFARLPR